MTLSCKRKDVLKSLYCLERTERIGQKGRAAKSLTSSVRAIAAKKILKVSAHLHTVPRKTGKKKS